jgi:tetratricopeptide (TPR) repeat protein
MACWGLGWLYNVRGEFAHAVPLLERAHAISRKWELSSWLANVPEELGFAYARSGRLDEGLGLLEESLKAYGALGRHPLTIHMGEAYLLAGRPDDAWAFGEKALALARRLGQRRLEALALYLLGEVASHGDSLPVGADLYGQAMGLAEVLGMRPLLAHCHLGLGKLYRRTGKGEQAREHLTAATTMYREMDMRFYLEQAAAEMASHRPIVGQPDGP